MRRVAVTGLGSVSALGENTATAWSNLMNGVCGIAEETISEPGLEGMDFSLPLARIKDDPVPKLRERFGPRQINSVDPFANLAAVATAEALADAGIEIGNPALRDAAILYATTSGGLVTLNQEYNQLFIKRRSSLHPLTVPRIMGSAGVSHISILFGIQGLAYALSSACASSAHAVSEGMHLIRSGRADMVITGGSDASLTYGSLRAWESLQALSPTACRPFSAERDGTAVGEGAATLILEDMESAQKRGARIYAEIAGSGATSDAAHITKPNAERAAAAVKAAHRDAGLDVNEPILLSAHGTGTILNDRTEAEVFRNVYGDSLNHNRVIATKSSHGHMLGATGAMEFLLAILAIYKKQAPAILNYIRPDEECRLPLVLKAEGIDFRAAMSTSFAFGGLNCALVAKLV
ncbi:hypothetical protein ASD44_16605 [Mesorhizobium sp. Root554]|uniref:beta-ketoacyl-[acyl-carrier-protein] synthase family protein n=1 Tax=unclassified Mesorhizobium TaxID=325217 RepID=UPI0006F4A43C|nr:MULTISPECIES: beta-ketoacyl-[acyl-carrier-protein] synthase family protein [unclassified Mesorhizobium]KQZ15495.1 hypothetical protein ASD27_16610 [Mesorhizobium sp. Root1471]KQZ38004.1 hypothetical protein ASD44_16605 [Mesorhizobium sp. Root554]